MSSESLSIDILSNLVDSNQETANLNNCDREPIHIPNLIQPHGVLLVLHREDYRIIQVSLNTEQLLGVPPSELLNKPIDDLIGKTQLQLLRNCLAEDFESINPLSISIGEGKDKLCFDAIVHSDRQLVLIELEPKVKERQVDFFDFYSLVKKPLSKIQNANSLQQLCDIIVGEIQKITGFDRVMVYRFDSEGAGTVIAEAVDEEQEPYLDLRYPATDVPKQAKYLYTLNYLRLIPDAAYEPVGITPTLNPITEQPLNLSMSVLRSVSPLHTEYLSNMGVGASMSISLLKDKQLWGLIACHHNSPKRIPYELRTVCEFIGQVVSFELLAKEANEDLDYRMKLKSIQSEFVESISAAEDLESGLTQDPARLLDLVSAEGVALSIGEEIDLIGKTPSPAAIAEMLPWLESQFAEDVVYETSCLSEAYPPAADFKETASGLLALLISRVHKTFIIWFRPEVVQTVDWGGNPNKPITIQADGTIRMSPRKSFARWQETVEGKSLAWKSCEVEAAIELRSSIVGIVLRKADELSQVNQELARSNIELDSFAYIASHDLKEPLRGIYNYSSFLIEDYGDVLDESGIDKLNTLMRLTHRMEDLINSLLHYSRLGRAELQLRSVDLNDLLAGVIDVFKVSERAKQVQFVIPRSLPTVDCDRTQVNELFTNLISNGIKYNQQPTKIIEIGYLDPQDPTSNEKLTRYFDEGSAPTVFYVRDNGIGIRTRHVDTIFRIFKRLHGQKKYGGGTGAGLTIAKKIVERHGGTIWVESTYGEGSTFYFTLQ